MPPADAPRETTAVVVGDERERMSPRQLKVDPCGGVKDDGSKGVRS
jgi:hypothetical protein